MPVYVLKKQNDAFLTVQIGTDLYKVPLRQSLKHSEVRKMMAFYQNDDKIGLYNYMCDLFEKHIPKSILDDLNESEMDNLFELWEQATEQYAGMKLGESSPSADLSTSTREPLTTTSLPEPDTQ